ncbi:iron-containing alcohol dehydrogenase [Siccirubricoccus sp. KC 17139]|uniref:Iron-containing alcohol dehydrogenase n=1 Tax=Siccirubricoccus soli TaxID=2899147 RepID=A0ABT1DAS7_9PROT|nr:iron-containing alcohol dehydrogenase [Siccirubricoccus soli]MCO6419047.1 iron-containing alcohol dehydrogenase [Siccirubricoccus soli]MCP2685182.1 iron-containing alcohol dehydrogenase [Siccirubricoccus soli]
MGRNGRVVFSRMEEVVFGRPAAAAVAELAERMGAKRVLVMASATLDRETGHVAGIRDALGPRFAAQYQGMPAHSPRAAVLDAARMAREAGADLIVTVGGGSITDAAKAVQLCLANDVDSTQAMDRLRSGGAPLRAPGLRQVTVPTTLSAGEFSAFAGVTDERSKVKEVFHHPGTIPAAVVLDPAMTLATPEWLFLSTGIRAVDHCVEGICSPEAHAFADAQALRGLALLASGLTRVKADPADIEARLDCQLGAWLSMAPLATGVPMGASHGIGYVLGAAFGIPHGHTSCIMLPAVMRWNLPANAERQAMVAAAMGQPGGEAAALLHRLIEGLGMPRSLGAVGIGRDAFDRIAEAAMATPWVPRNPRRIEGPAQVREILELAA